MAHFVVPPPAFKPCPKRFRVWDGHTMWSDVIFDMFEEPPMQAMLELRGASMVTAEKKWTFLMSTGVHDSDDTEIFEGDVVEDRMGQRALVVYGNLSFEADTDEGRVYKIGAGFQIALGMGALGHNPARVIGNVYENPDLLLLGESP